MQSENATQARPSDESGIIIIASAVVGRDKDGKPYCKLNPHLDIPKSDKRVVIKKRLDGGVTMFETDDPNEADDLPAWIVP